MVYQLDNEIWFPDPRLADENGLLAVGGDLSVERLLLAYSYGIFPWYGFREKQKMWFCPHKRFVIFPNEIHVSHSMRTLINKHRYRLSINEDFEGVIANCSRLRYDEYGAWLGEEMVAAYTELHRQGFAASVEVWEQGIKGKENTPSTSHAEGGNERLVGGLYGVCLGPAFFGESMFSLVPSASKLALIHLARIMEKNGGTLIDCQLKTPHLESMGGRFISYDEYIRLIQPNEK